MTTEIAAVTMADLKTVCVTPYHASVDECSESPQSDIRCTEATGSMPHAAPLIDRRVSDIDFSPAAAPLSHAAGPCLTLGTHGCSIPPLTCLLLVGHVPGPPGVCSPWSNPSQCHDCRTPHLILSSSQRSKSESVPWSAVINSIRVSPLGSEPIL